MDKNKTKRIVILTVSCILLLLISVCAGCNYDGTDSGSGYYPEDTDAVSEEEKDDEEEIEDDEEKEDEAEIVKAPCTINITGAEKYYKDGHAPHFSLFIKDGQSGEWKFYTTILCEEEVQNTRLAEGDYKFYSEDLGRVRFSVVDPEKEYCIDIDYYEETVSFSSEFRNVSDAEQP